MSEKFYLTSYWPKYSCPIKMWDFLIITIGICRGLQMPVFELKYRNYVPKLNENWCKTTQLFNHIFHANASTCCQTFNLWNTFKNTELQNWWIPVSATRACVNVSQCEINDIQNERFDFFFQMNSHVVFLHWSDVLLF